MTVKLSLFFRHFTFSGKIYIKGVANYPEKKKFYFPDRSHENDVCFFLAMLLKEKEGENLIYISGIFFFFAALKVHPMLAIISMFGIQIHISQNDLHEERKQKAKENGKNLLSVMEQTHLQATLIHNTGMWKYLCVYFSLSVLFT